MYIYIHKKTHPYKYIYIYIIYIYIYYILYIYIIYIQRETERKRSIIFGKKIIIFIFILYEEKLARASYLTEDLPNLSSKILYGYSHYSCLQKKKNNIYIYI